MGRLIYANLDGENELAGLGTPPRRVLDRLAGWARLLRAFAVEDGDEIRLPWSAGSVVATRLDDVSGLPRPRLGTGRLTGSDRGRPLLPWLVTPEVDAFAAPATGLTAEELRQLPLHELLWRLPRPSSSIVRRVHHRAFALAVARESGCALPGARLAGSFAELLEICGNGAWVVKAPLSAAGRERYVHGGGALGAPQRRTVERLFDRHGELLYEPWMERLDDFGCVALAAVGEVRIAGLHRQRVDRQGRFQGIELASDPLDGAGLRPMEKGRLLEMTREVGRRLLAAGYQGAFGVDAWRYRDGAGVERFHPLGEINARPSFGLVIRALGDRWRASRAIFKLQASGETLFL